MTRPPQGNIAVELGERLVELGVLADMCGQVERFERIRTGNAILVTTDLPGHRVKWGVCRPDIPYDLFLKEVLP